MRWQDFKRELRYAWQAYLGPTLIGLTITVGAYLLMIGWLALCGDC